VLQRPAKHRPCRVFPFRSVPEPVFLYHTQAVLAEPAQKPGSSTRPTRRAE